jgi:hypothetical protein
MKVNYLDVTEANTLRTPLLVRSTHIPSCYLSTCSLITAAVK